MKIYKKILLILFLFICVLFIKNNVFAYSNTSDTGYVYTFPDELLEIIKSSEYYSDDYYCVAVKSTYHSGYYVYYIEKKDGLQISFDAGNNFMANMRVNIQHYVYNLDFTQKNYTYLENNNFNSGPHFGNNSDADVFYLANGTFYCNNYSKIFYEDNVDSEYVFPYISDTDEVLSNLDEIDDILIFPGSLSKEYLPLKLSIYKNTDDVTTELIFELSLDTSSPYYLYIVENPEDYWWEIPTELFKNSLESNQNYSFVLSGINEYNEFSITRFVTYYGTTYVPPTDEQLQTDAIKDQTEKIEEQTDAIIEQTGKIEEQTEVNKGIFARIGEILSYINPLSENFFAYKLIDLLIDAIKSLFIPEDGFLSTYFDELFDWFCDRLGFLSYPLELILDILDKIVNINFSEPIINIPEIKEPITNQTLIAATSYNFNSLLENETLARVHDIYLIVVDALLAFGMVNLLKKKLEEVTSQ